MKIEHLFLASLAVVGIVFVSGLIRVLLAQKKRRKLAQIPGYQLKKGHLDFHVAYVKNYPTFTLAFFPLVDAQMVTSFPGKGNKGIGFKGIACLYATHHVENDEDGPLLDLIRSHFSREELSEEESIILYKEDCDFMSLEMREFVAELDRQIEEYLKVSSSLAPL